MGRLLWCAVVLGAAGAAQAGEPCAREQVPPLTVRSTEHSVGIGCLKLTRKTNLYDAPGYHGVEEKGPLGKKLDATCSVFTPFGTTTARRQQIVLFNLLPLPALTESHSVQTWSCPGAPPAVRCRPERVCPPPCNLEVPIPACP